MFVRRNVCIYSVFVQRPTDRSALVRIEHSVSSSDVNNKTCKQYEANAKQKETEKTATPDLQYLELKQQQQQQ